jgi:uncharacterized oligopeptide transporter (OPT) family protein
MGASLVPTSRHAPFPKLTIPRSPTAFTNLYFGLQTGWISMMSLQSALLGYGLFAGLMRLPLPPALRPTRAFTPQENVVLQTTAVATGTLPLAAGLVGIIPAMEMLDFERDGESPIFLGWGALMAWSAAVAFFGCVLGGDVGS